MSVKINGDNSLSKPAITGSDADSGLRVDGNNIDNVIDGSQRLRIDGAGIQVLRNAESFSQIRRIGAVNDNDYIGALSWKAQNSSGATEYEYVKLNTQIKDVTAGSENSRFIIETRRDGSMFSSFECHDGITTQPSYPFCIASQSGQGWTNLNQSSGNPRNVGILAANGNFHVNSNTDVFYSGNALGAGSYRVLHAKYAGVYRVDMQLYQRSAAHNRVYLQKNASHVVIQAELSQQTEDMTSTYSGVVTVQAGDYFNFRVEYNNVNADLYWSANHTQITITKIG